VGNEAMNLTRAQALIGQSRVFPGTRWGEADAREPGAGYMPPPGAGAAGVR
jgi:hypothetical protein